MSDHMPLLVHVGLVIPAAWIVGYGARNDEDRGCGLWLAVALPELVLMLGVASVFVSMGSKRKKP